MDVVSKIDGRASISRLSVATGMTRKEVAALLKDTENTSAAAGARGQQRALRVLKGWMTDSRFRNRRGRPCELYYRGNQASFSMLVKLYGGDVTPKSVLRELQRINVVATTSTGKLRLRLSRSGTDMEMNYRLADLAALFEDFAFSAIHANENPHTSSSMFGYKRVTTSSAREAARLMRRFSNRAAALLEDFQRWAGAHKATNNRSSQNRDTKQLGLGVYLVSPDSFLDRLPLAATAGAIERREKRKQRTGRIHQ